MSDSLEGTMNRLEVYVRENDSRTNWHDKRWYLRLHAEFVEQERRAAAEAMRETCAQVVQNWHIRKGGYTELSHVLRSIDTPDDGRG